MKRLLALLLALTLVLSLCACAKSDTPTETTSGAPTSPTAPQPTDPADPAPENPDKPDETDMQIASRLILNYTWYQAVGICCEFELVNADLSAFIPDTLTQPYFNQQYKILCCKSPEEVRGHIDRCISKELQDSGYPDDRLFTDDQGNLYLIIIPTGYVGYRDVAVARSGDCLYAKAGAYAEDGWFADAYFTIETLNENHMIIQVLHTAVDEIPAEIKDLPFRSAE